MKIGQKSETLIEVIAALAIVSIISTIAWTALSIGFQQGTVETSKTRMQQNANLVVSTLVNEHRRSDSYYLKFENGQLDLKSCIDNEGSEECQAFRQITDNEFTYSGSINGVDFEVWNEACKIIPEEEHVDIDLQVADPADTNSIVTVDATLTRILTTRSEGVVGSYGIAEAEACG